MDLGTLQLAENRMEQNETCGQFDTEKQAEDWLCGFLESTKSFKLYRQLDGFPVFRHHMQQMQNIRCDILALPINDQITTGAIVIEVKRSGEKIGPGLSQLQDYLRSVFPVKNAICVAPTIGFLFPCPKQHRAAASWMQHQHLGTVFQADISGNLMFFTGEERLIEFNNDGSLRFSRASKCGRGMGSR
jgi:hypothetical protein